MDRQQVEALAKGYEQLEMGFKNTEKQFQRICKDGFLGFKLQSSGSTKALVGFGQPIFFEWRFVIHGHKGHGQLLAYSDENHLHNESGFYRGVYFRSPQPVFFKSLGQKTGDFYGNSLVDMEELLSEIIGGFLGQECFKP